MRRTIFIFGCLVALALCGKLHAQQGNTFLYKVGNWEIILLPEDQGEGNTSILIGADEGLVGYYLTDGKFKNAVNAFVVRTPEGPVLFDTGVGKNLHANLRSAGIDPGDVRKVMLTHMHGDHIGGLLADDEPAFPNAKLVIGRKEHEYWTSDIEMNKLAAERRSSFAYAKKVISKYENNLELVDTYEITNVPAKEGIHPVSAFGHTPGHTAYMINTDNGSFLIWGDLTHAMAIQMPHPEIAVTYDVDPGAAIISRMRILRHVAEHGIPVGGMHVAYPGIGIVMSNGIGGYEFVEAFNE